MRPSEADTGTLVAATIGLAKASIPVPVSWQLELQLRGITPSEISAGLALVQIVEKSQQFIEELGGFDDVDRENVAEVGGVIYALS